MRLRGGESGQNAKHDPVFYGHILHLLLTVKNKKWPEGAENTVFLAFFQKLICYGSKLIYSGLELINAGTDRISCGSNSSAFRLELIFYESKLIDFTLALTEVEPNLIYDKPKPLWFRSA
ncbi:hypothetical protein [Parapedobacter sp.]